MGASELLEVAKEGDILLGDDMQESIDRLLAIANDLSALLEKETDIEVAREIGRFEQGLHSLAMSLVNIQIELLVGQARITAVHINAAVEYAEAVIASTKAWKKRVQTIGKLVDFFSVVLTGDGAKIVEAAIKLKENLDKA